MTTSILIYGIGAMARVIASYVRRTHDIIGYTVDDVVIQNGQTQFNNLPLYPFSQIRDFVAPNACKVIMTVGYRNMNDLKLERIKQLQDQGFEITGYCDPNLVRHDDVSIDETAIILDQVSIHPGSQIGPHAFITSQVNIGHDCQIGEAVWINGGVSIGGGASIGRLSVLSMNSCIAHGVEMGERVFVGANTLVQRSIADDGVVLSASGELHRLKSRSFLKFAKLEE